MQCLVPASHAPKGVYHLCLKHLIKCKHSTNCAAHRCHSAPADTYHGRLNIFFIQKWQEGEDAVQFANRVKSAIAHQGGLVDLQW